MQQKTFETEIGGKKMVAEFSDLADQAHGSVILRYGDTVVLATAVMSDSTRDIDFFPLVVDYEEKFYAAGEILGSRFQRREGRPSEEAILSGRIIDRTIRPLFDHGIRNEVQVVTTVLSLGDTDSDILAVNAASLALAVSDIPWNGPVSAVRIARSKEGTLIVNPSFEERSASDLELTVCGKGGDVNMIEAGASQAAETAIAEGLEKAGEEIVENGNRVVGLNRQGKEFQLPYQTQQNARLDSPMGQHGAVDGHRRSGAPGGMDRRF